MKIIINIPEDVIADIKENYVGDDVLYCGVKYGEIVDVPIIDAEEDEDPYQADMDEAIKCIKDVEGDDAIWAISLIEWACAKRTSIEAESEG